jgi:predicted ester cyclase
MKQFHTMVHAAIPDLQLTVEDLIAEGDKVVGRFTASGTQQGEFMDIPPTGKPFTRLFDQMGLMQQLGAIPPI